MEKKKMPGSSIGAMQVQGEKSRGGAA